jgi:hypothetical protein
MVGRTIPDFFEAYRRRKLKEPRQWVDVYYLHTRYALRTQDHTQLCAVFMDTAGRWRIESSAHSWIDPVERSFTTKEEAMVVAEAMLELA